MSTKKITDFRHWRENEISLLSMHEVNNFDCYPCLWYLCDFIMMSYVKSYLGLHIKEMLKIPFEKWKSKILSFSALRRSIKISFDLFEADYEMHLADGKFNVYRSNRLRTSKINKPKKKWSQRDNNRNRLINWNEPNHCWYQMECNNKI